MRKKIIFIGNSIVAGYPWGKSKSFTGVLRRMLKDGVDNSGLPIEFAKSTGFDLINKGVNGDTTSGIAARFEQDVLSHKPDLVFYHTGANDFIYREATPEEAFANLQTLAERSDQEGIETVYITPVPVDAGKAGYMWLAGCGISYDAVNRDLETFSEMLKSTGRPFVDMNQLYRQFIETLGDVDLAYLDGVHPTPAGHEFIAEQILDLIEKETLYK
jgi:lysophospholipase L1-like esterase